MPDAALLEDIQHVESDQTILETQRIQLAKARVGQGLFRTRVVLIGDGVCRVTGVSDQRLLIASHIKPWRSSNNAERLNGHNGILLSPHVDALFDEHLKTFEDDGTMHTHPSLSRDVLDRWHIDPTTRLDSFSAQQAQFLALHRDAFAARLR